MRRHGRHRQTLRGTNPGTKVILDVVPYKTINEQLPVQLAAGQGPDIARVTELGGLSKYYLDISPYVKDRVYWETNFGATLPWPRGPAPRTKASTALCRS